MIMGGGARSRATGALLLATTEFVDLLESHPPIEMCAACVSCTSLATARPAQLKPTLGQFKMYWGSTFLQKLLELARVNPG